jgi:hypothetical protein
MCSLDHVPDEPESKVQAEQAQVEETNPEIAQGKPQCIPPIIFYFSFNHYFMLTLIVH